MRKTLNLVLASGLNIIHAKVREGTPVVTLFITDYTNDTRVLFDMDQKRILANKDNIDLTAEDIKNLVAALEPKKSEKAA